MPKVSTIIPNFNQARYIRDAIQSALDQTYQDYEIIVIDDGSTDNSQALVAGFGDQVRYIRQENQGLAGARNTGIRAAKGEFIGLLDADDQWSSDYLERMVALANQYPEVAVYYCTAQSMDEQGRDLPQVFGGPALPTDVIYYVLLRANFIIPSTILMRCSAVMAVDLFDQSLRSCEDWDLWLRFLQDHSIIGTSKCLVRYRLHTNTLSADPSGMQQATRAVIEKHFGPDDGIPQTWSEDKRRAYGGVYRYHMLTSAQRQIDWGAAGEYLQRALLADPTLATDLDLFYDLAHSNQPPGYRGTSYQLNLKVNAERIINMVGEVFASSGAPELDRLRRETYGTAYYALGLLAYHIEDLSLSRRFLLHALSFRPELWRDSRVTGNFSKSFLTPKMLDKLKHYKAKILNGDMAASEQ